MTRLVLLGETHHGTHLEQIKKFLEVENEFDGVFVELAVDYQRSITYFLESGKVGDDLKAFFKCAEIEGKDVQGAFLYLLGYAKVNGISVVCIDSSKTLNEYYFKKSEYGYYFLHGESRDEDMYWTIKNSMKLGEKWLCLVGAMHLVNEIHHRTGKKTLVEWLRSEFGECETEVVVLK